MKDPANISPPDLWAITAYFNPLKHESRLKNYRLFRKNLNAPLIAVELVYGGEPELGPDDADRLIQIRGGDVLWQKERLLNIAIRETPSTCCAIAWLDCDVVFENPDWALIASGLLSQHKIIQPFQTVELLRPGTFGQSLPLTRNGRRDSLAARMCNGSIPPEIFRTQGASLKYLYAPGLAWAGRRDLLLEHGLYDAMIMGSGDKVIAAAAYGRFQDAVLAFGMNEAMAEHYLTWAIPFYEAVRCNVGFAKLRIQHLWHGDVEKRMYSSRYRGFSNFDPCRDIAVDSGGAWRWRTNDTAIQDRIRSFFRARDEDGGQ
jgi:hypothetical protein